VDAGTVHRRSVELRTALIFVYPEYRDTAVLEATGRVTRTIPGLTDASRDEALKKLKFTPASDGGWELNSLHLSQTAPETLSSFVSFDADHLGHLYISASGLTSEELGMYLPRELPTGTERFTFFVHYASAPARSRALVQQAVRLLLANSLWKVEGAPLEDSDGGAIPDDETVLVRSTDGATITFHRTGGQVRAEYALDTLTVR
jgi:hypothetical protein